MKENPEVQVLGKPLKITLAILRYVMAVQFLWAFFDKLLGLGFSTKSEGAWIRGGSPTFGFLTKGATGPFAGIFNAIGGKGLDRCAIYACTSWCRNSIAFRNWNENWYNFRFGSYVFYVGRYTAKNK